MRISAACHNWTVAFEEANPDLYCHEVGQDLRDLISIGKGRLERGTPQEIKTYLQSGSKCIMTEHRLFIRLLWRQAENPNRFFSAIKPYYPGFYLPPLGEYDHESAFMDKLTQNLPAKMPRRGMFTIQWSGGTAAFRDRDTALRFHSLHGGELHYD